MHKLRMGLFTTLLMVSLSACGKGNIPQNQTASPVDLDTVTTEEIQMPEESSQTADTEAASVQETVAALVNLPDRIPGSENNTMAAEWVSAQYALLELKPLAKEDYFWPYEQILDGHVLKPNNVVGYIAGSDPSQAVIISCHLDAVNGSSGAVDNASGVAAMLRVATNLLAEPEALPVDYIFCAFNGEEQNYAGSIAFVEELKEQYEIVHNINFDCVGVIDGGSYMFGVETEEVGYELNMEMRPYLDKYRISYGSYPVSSVRSDHISFENAGIPNINFTQYGIPQFTHSSRDQAEQLDMAQIELLADCVTEYLLK